MEKISFKQNLILTIVGAVATGIFVVLGAMNQGSGGGVVMGGININPGSTYAIANGGTANASTNIHVEDNRIYSNNGNSTMVSNKSSVVQTSNSSSTSP